MTKKKIIAIILLPLLLLGGIMPLSFAEEESIDAEPIVEEVYTEVESMELISSEVIESIEEDPSEEVAYSSQDKESSFASESVVDEVVKDETVLESQVIQVNPVLEIIEPKVLDSDFKGKIQVKINKQIISNAISHLNLKEKDNIWASINKTPIKLLVNGNIYDSVVLNNSDIATFDIKESFEPETTLKFNWPVIEFIQIDDKNHNFVTSYLEIADSEMRVSESVQQEKTSKQLQASVDVVSGDTNEKSMEADEWFYTELKSDYQFKIERVMTEKEEPKNKISGKLDVVTINKQLALSMEEQNNTWTAIRKNKLKLIVNDESTYESEIGYMGDFSFVIPRLYGENNKLVFKLDTAIIETSMSGERLPRISYLHFEDFVMGNIDGDEMPSTGELRFANELSTDFEFNPITFSYQSEITTYQKDSVTIKILDSREEGQWELQVSSNSLLLSSDESASRFFPAQLILDNQIIDSTPITIASSENYVSNDDISNVEMGNKVDNKFKLSFNPLNLTSTTEHSIEINWTLVDGL